MKALGAQKWSMTHAFMANMGGLVVQAGESAPFIATGPMLEMLVKEGVIGVPNMKKEEIDDKSKADFVGKVLTITQAAWLILTTIARARDKLAIAPVEMAACLFVMSSLMKYVLQW